MILNLLPVAITWQDITIAWYFITTGDMVQRMKVNCATKVTKVSTVSKIW